MDAAEIADATFNARFSKDSNFLAVIETPYAQHGPSSLACYTEAGSEPSGFDSPAG